VPIFLDKTARFPYNEVMNHRQLKHYRLGIIAIVILAMLCGGMFPQMEFCYCEDCSCPVNVFRQMKKCAADSSTLPSQCCRSEQVPAARAGETHQFCCQLNSSCNCRCSDNTVSRTTAIRSSGQKLGDNIKKSFDFLHRTIAKDFSSVVVSTMDGARSQYNPHIHLPRLHLLLSVLLN